MSYSKALRVTRNTGLVLLGTYAIASFILWDLFSPFATVGLRSFCVYMLFLSIYFGFLIDMITEWRRAKAAGIPVREG